MRCAAEACGRCMCGRGRFVALAAFDDPVDRTPDRHASFEEHVGWIPWPDAGAR